MKLWVYEDAHNWGSAIAAGAIERGWDATLFDNPRQPDEGLLFMYMSKHPTMRDRHKRMMAQFATQPEISLIPSYFISRIFDDRLEQARVFAEELPRTHVITSPAVAREFLEKSKLRAPFISKPGSGDGVRLVRTEEEARKEIKLAFSDIGVRSQFGFQRSFVYWQERLPEDTMTFRIIVIGEQRMVVRRSASFDHYVDLTDDAVEAIAMVNRICKKYSISWAGFDVSKDAKGHWRLLEITASWPSHHYNRCKFFPDGRLGVSYVDVMLDEIEKGNL